MPKRTLESGSALWDGKTHKPGTFGMVDETGTSNWYFRELAKKNEESRMAMKELCRHKDRKTPHSRIA